MSWFYYDFDKFDVQRLLFQILKKFAIPWAFFQKNRMCISMELVTAVLGDHGQRPREDYGKVFFLVLD